ncbi:MAG TPA: hypothetical protein VF763_13210 [Candidatus Limnocylindrales bacterium]
MRGRIDSPFQRSQRPPRARWEQARGAIARRHELLGGRAVPVLWPAGQGDDAVALGAPSSAEVAECACPEFCERDHANE